MVQKGKFSAAAWLFVNTLKKVDFLEIKTAVRSIHVKPLVCRAWWFDRMILKHLCTIVFLFTQRENRKKVILMDWIFDHLNQKYYTNYKVR